MTGRTALYVYALVPYRPGVADDVTGLDGRPLRLLHVPGTDLAALVHDASPAPFEGGDEQVRRWVGEQNQAVTTVWERTGSILPMTFNVLVADAPASGDSSDGEPADRELADRESAGGASAVAGATEPGSTAEERLTRWAGERAPDITARLDELADRCELRVEITVDRSAVVAQGRQGTQTPQAEQEAAHRSPGMRRLMAKQREHEARNTAGRLADSLHAEVRHDLLAVAEDFHDRGFTHTGPDETGVLSAALLVRNKDIDAVGTLLSRVQSREPAVRIRFLGPWPPYSFTDDRYNSYEEQTGQESTFRRGPISE